jgi:hypothetical protein
MGKKIIEGEEWRRQVAKRRGDERRNKSRGDSGSESRSLRRIARCYPQASICLASGGLKRC